MVRILKGLAGFIFACGLFAQTPDEWKPRQFVALGAGAQSLDAPKPTGWGVYATEIRPKMFSYSHATWVADKPNTVETGLAFTLMQQSRVSLLSLGTVGAGFGESNVGLAFSGGGALHVRFAKTLGVLLAIRAQDTSVTRATPVYQIGLCWGGAF